MGIEVGRAADIHVKPASIDESGGIFSGYNSYEKSVKVLYDQLRFCLFGSYIWDLFI